MRYVEPIQISAYGRLATIRLGKEYSAEKVRSIFENAAGAFHSATGIFVLLSDNCIRETTLHLRDKGLLKHEVKYLAGIARADIDRWKKKMRANEIFQSYDAVEAALIDHVGPLQKDIDMVELQANQYFTMHGAEDPESFAKISLAYFMLKSVRQTYEGIREGYVSKEKIDFADTFGHCLLDRAEKAWKELSLLIIGNKAKGIENYQPLDTALTILIRKASDIDNLMLRMGDAVEEFADDFDEDVKADIKADMEKIHSKQAEIAKRRAQETAAARRKQEKLVRKRKSTDITDEDLQRLKERFTA